MNKGKVILLHGLESNALVMHPMARRLSRDGYDVHNSTYKCNRRSWQEVAEDVRKSINSEVKDGELVNFVCHSLGGIIVRYCIDKGLRCCVGKIVTISSPHDGAHWVNDIPFGREIGYLLFGHKMVDSLMDVKSVQSLPNLTPYHTFCITTSKPMSLSNPLSWLAGRYIVGSSDGFVSLEGQKLIGADSTNFHLDHLWSVKNRKVIGCVLNYLNYGGL